ncbi:MAG: uracil-DNA glycosylase [Rhodospirillaceae bacterium]
MSEPFSEPGAPLPQVPQTIETPEMAAAVLRWYQQAGLSLTVQEAPCDWYQRAEQTKPVRREPEPRKSAAPVSARPPSFGQAASPAPSGPAPMPARRPVLVGEEVAEARQLAAAATDLTALREAMDGYQSCALRRTATHTVFADGNPDADVMLVGEAPGAEEDRRGLPFVGPSGKLLDAMLASIGLTRATVYISNVLPWRPPGNRKPTPEEVALCEPFLARHIALVKPRLLLLTGGLAAQTLMDTTTGITRLRGQWKDYQPAPEADPIPALATFHPAFLLRSPVRKREAWRDLLALKERLDLVQADGV